MLHKNGLNLEKLFEMQRTLDRRIEVERGLENEDLFERKVLAFQVELGELANETRCFKFWSSKEPAAKEVILEEYVDGLHFILSLGLEMGWSEHVKVEKIELSPVPLTALFNRLFAHAGIFVMKRDRGVYEQLLHTFLSLGISLGFSDEDINDAYFSKNELNHQRQEEGY